jgi:hypothetical protein
MVVLRCTRKLLRHVGPAISADDPAARSRSRLGDWYANAVVVRRRHIVLAVSGVTLLPVLLPAAPYKTMIGRFADAAGEVLRALGIPEAKVVEELSGLHDLVVAPTNDRRVLGSMNDFAWMMQGYFEDTRSLLDVALKLSEAPCSPLGMKNPRESTRAVLTTPTLRLVTR